MRIQPLKEQNVVNDKTFMAASVGCRKIHGFCQCTGFLLPSLELFLRTPTLKTKRVFLTKCSLQVTGANHLTLCTSFYDIFVDLKIVIYKVKSTFSSMSFCSLLKFFTMYMYQWSDVMHVARTYKLQVIGDVTNAAQASKPNFVVLMSRGVFYLSVLQM